LDDGEGDGRDDECADGVDDGEGDGRADEREDGLDDGVGDGRDDGRAVGVEDGVGDGRDEGRDEGLMDDGGNIEVFVVSTGSWFASSNLLFESSASSGSHAAPKGGRSTGRRSPH